MVERADVVVVGPPVAQARWADDLPPQYATHTILRLRTSDGVEGVAGAASYTGHGWSTAVAETLRTIVPDVLGVSALDREHVWPRVRERTFPVPPQAHSLIDIALWDIAARGAGLPLYQFLGGRTSTIQAYASMPLLPSIGALRRGRGEVHRRGIQGDQGSRLVSPGGGPRAGPGAPRGVRHDRSAVDAGR